MAARITTISCLIVIMATILVRSHRCQQLNGGNETNLRIASSQFFVRSGIYKLKELWQKFEAMGQNENTIVGRCLGVARKLKFVLPLIVFKLGVIGTMLVFLTLFAIKSVGIGLLLLIINISKLVGKAVYLKLDHGNHQGYEKVINYHVYKEDDHHQHHHRHPSSSGYGDDIFTSSGWHDKTDSLKLTPLQRLQLLQLYDKYGMGGLNKI